MKYDDTPIPATYFPITWFLDRKGQIAFKKVEWTKELVEEFSWRIEKLRQE